MKKMTAVLAAILLTSTYSLADGTEGHMTSDSHMMSDGQMMKDDQMMGDNAQHGMRSVMGVGQVNKVRMEQHMINITHEPITEMNWPKMRMNFQASEQVNLSELKPGQKINFVLEVDKENNYLIKEIKVLE